MQLNRKNIDEVREKMAKEHNLNVFALPEIKKVTINVGVGDYKESKENMEQIIKELASVTGQKPRATQAKVSISGFKTRKGERIGLSVTLRGRKMWDFIERLTNIVLPRMREFDGINLASFDKNNNFSYGIKEQSAFPEIDPNEIKFIWGMGISISLINAGDKDLTVQYLKNLGFVFK